MAGEKKERRPRRSFTDEFKAEVVKRVVSGTKTAGQVARELDLTETAVRAWVKQAKTDTARAHLEHSPRRSARSCPVCVERCVS